MKIFTIEEIAKKSNEEIFTSAFIANLLEGRQASNLRYFLERDIKLMKIIIPDSFNIPGRSGIKGATSTTRLNPVNAVNGGDGWESEIASAPSSEIKKKVLIIDGNFFAKSSYADFTPKTFIFNKKRIYQLLCLQRLGGVL